MIDLLKMLGLLTGLPTTLLGLTVLAWGNSIGDYMANTSIARKGFGEMALTGCFASPIFNILLGIGFSTLKINLVGNGAEGIRFSSKDNESGIPLTMIFGSFVSLVFTLIMTTIVNNNRITKTQAKITIGIYVCTLISAMFQAKI